MHIVPDEVVMRCLHHIPVKQKLTETKKEFF